jgi:hypothetical protein
LSAAAFLLALIATTAGQGRAEDIRLDALKIPAAISGANRTVELEAIVVRPDDGEPAMRILAGRPAAGPSTTRARMRWAFACGVPLPNARSSTSTTSRLNEGRRAIAPGGREGVAGSRSRERASSGSPERNKSG